MYDSTELTHAFCINMPAIVKIPETTSEHQAIIAYLQSNIIPPNIQKNRVLISFVVARSLKSMKTTSYMFPGTIQWKDAV